MTREEAVKILKRIKLAKEYITDYTDVIEAFNMAIKALEQKPFINKPCVSEGVCREDKIQVLDKIRAEIEDLTYYCWEVSPRTVIDDVLEIIDKHKTESEEKGWNLT